MRSGNWTTSNVLTVTPRISVDGKDKPVLAASVTREIPAVLPGQAASTGGMAAASGDVEWAQHEEVTTRVVTPWTRRDYPSRGQRITVRANDGANEHQLFTGITNGTQGQFANPAHGTTLIDDIDKLNTSVSHRALAAVMPPLSTLNNEHRRMIGIIPSYVTDLCARASGFYATPPADGFCIMSAPMMGATWPERGELRASYRSDDVGGWGRYQPWWTSTAWGCAFHRGLADYDPDLSLHDGKITASRPLNITLMAGRVMSTSAYVSTRYAQDYEMRLAVTSARSLAAQTVDNAGTITTRLTMTAGTAGAWETATLRVAYNGSPGSYTLTITTDTGATASAVYTTSTWLEGAPTRVRVYAPEGAPLGGVQVSGTSLAPAASRFTRTAKIDTETNLHRIDAIPAIDAVKALDLLKAQSEAESSAFWIDEDGMFRWVPREKLTAGPSLHTLTAVRIKNVVFRIDGEDSRRKTTVKYRQAATSTAKSSRLVCYEGSKNELEEGDDEDIWITPPADEDWIQVDSTARTVWGDENAAYFNEGQGTFLGYTCLYEDGREFPMVSSDTKEYSFTPVGAAAWHYKLKVVDLPSTVPKVKTATRNDDSTGLSVTYRDRGLPLVRCMGIITWSDQEFSPGVTGPGWAAELEHDVSWFIQDPAQVQAIGWWIAQQTANPHPVVESVEIIPDPRLQLGDKVTVQDDKRTGVTITGVITGITHNFNGPVYGMSLKLLVTQVTTPDITVDEFDAWYSGMTVDALDTSLAGATLEQLNANPLR